MPLSSVCVFVTMDTNKSTSEHTLGLGLKPKFFFNKVAP